MEEFVKRVWIVNHSSIPPELGGLNRHHYFSKYLSKNCFDVKIITSSAIHNSKINIIDKADKNVYKVKVFGGVEYTFVKTSSYKGNGISRIKNLIEFPKKLKKLFRQLGKTDIIYTSSPSPFAAAQAIRLAKRMKVPVILEVRDLWPETIVVLKGLSKKNPVIWLMYKLEKWMYKKADRLVFTFEGGIDYIKERKWENDIDISKISNINNGVDIEEFKANQSKIFEDEELGNSKLFKVVYTGSIRLSYGLKNVIDAAKIIKEEMSDIKFLLYGDGNEKDDLEAMCQEKGLDNIVFKGRVEKDKIPYILSCADITLIHVNKKSAKELGRYGMSNNKLFDYLASGKPIVSNYQANYDIVKRYNCGVVTDDLSSRSLADAIINIYNMDDKSYKIMSENALRIAADYDFKKLTSKLEYIIKETLS